MKRTNCFLSIFPYENPEFHNSYVGKVIGLFSLFFWHVIAFMYFKCTLMRTKSSGEILTFFCSKLSVKFIVMCKSFMLHRFDVVDVIRSSSKNVQMDLTFRPQWLLSNVFKIFQKCFLKHKVAQLFGLFCSNFSFFILRANYVWSWKVFYFPQPMTRRKRFYYL